MQNIISEQFQYIAALTRMLLCDIIVLYEKEISARDKHSSVISVAQIRS